MKWFRRILFSIGIFYILATLFMFLIQEKLIFRSEILPQDFKYTFTTPFKELFLKADDGSILNGLHFTQPNAKGVILYFHGNAGALDNWGLWAEEIANTYQYDVVIMDYRGYGKSIGKRTHQKMLADSELFYNYCKNHFSEDNITVFGRSLGGSFATHVTQKNNPKQLILEATFTSIKDIVKKRYWFLPVTFLLKFPFQNDKNITQITTKTYFIHGTADRVVPYEYGKKLYQLSASKEKKLFTIKNGLHNNLRDYNTYHKVLSTILK